MPSREEKKAATRKRLLDAAAALVASEGAQAATLDAIAERAGLTKGAVYSNFRGKDDLLFALAERAGPNITGEDVLSETAPVADQLERLGEELAEGLRRVSRRAWRLGLELTFWALRNERARRALAASDRESHAELGRFFEAAAAATGKPLPLPGEQFAVVVDALAFGLAQKHAIDPASVPDDLFPKALRLLAG
jgi:AcrR family transcriptional regulator